MTDSPDPRSQPALVPLGPSADPPPLPDFVPVPVRPRLDGWTAERQRAFIEHLADGDDVRAACAAVGMSEQAAFALRRRPDADGFDAAWTAAIVQRKGALIELAVDRAIKGRVRGKYWKGELVAEERVPSDRMLIWLIEKGSSLIAGADRRREAAEQLADTMTALEDVTEAPRFRIWCDEDLGQLRTNAPPPAGFTGIECGDYGQAGYWRCPTREESLAWANRPDDAQDAAANEAARRAFFGLDQAKPSAKAPENVKKRGRA